MSEEGAEAAAPAQFLYWYYHELRATQARFPPGESARSIESLQKEMWLHLQRKSCEYSNERKCILVQDWLGPEGQKI